MTESLETLVFRGDEDLNFHDLCLFTGLLLVTSPNWPPLPIPNTSDPQLEMIFKMVAWTISGSHSAFLDIVGV